MSNTYTVRVRMHARTHICKHVILNKYEYLYECRHKTGTTGRLSTCIAGHPEEECVATGDSTGRVVIWRNLFQTRPYTAVFHWHTLPVTEIIFSKSGNRF
jgi:NET1-associated nuclear protein 1 (U3 small nucleolar RNA-associated protein 17)